MACAPSHASRVPTPTWKCTQCLLGILANQIRASEAQLNAVLCSHMACKMKTLKMFVAMTGQNTKIPKHPARDAVALTSLIKKLRKPCSNPSQLTHSASAALRYLVEALEKFLRWMACLKGPYSRMLRVKMLMVQGLETDCQKQS